MSKARKIKWQITLIAFTDDGDGTRSVADVVETSHHFASHFARSFMRDTEVCAFRACAPGSVTGREWSRTAGAA